MTARSPARTIHVRREIIGRRVHPQQSFKVRDTFIRQWLHPTKGWRKSDRTEHVHMVSWDDLHRVPIQEPRS